VWILALVFWLFLFIWVLFRRRFFGLNVSSWFLVCFFAVFRFCGFFGGVGGCGIKTGIFRRICGVDGCGKVSGVWESFVDVQDRGVGGCS